VGSTAFEVFAWRGRMSHDLAEPIPGAPPFSSSGNALAALQRLTMAIESFRAWSEPLHPHFAYGELSKSDYDLAHAMHIANHLSQFSHS
jgi:hypothetical protein